jgi:predicted nucleic acid-binding protein
MKRTFVDTSVLIAAFRGQDAIARKAWEVLDDPEREFASSAFVKLETLPKAIYYQHTDEAAFYQAFFDQVRYWAENLPDLTLAAYQEACRCGLSAVDALHVAAAATLGADELVTTEKRASPLHRTKSVQVVSIHEG